MVPASISARLPPQAEAMEEEPERSRERGREGEVSGAAQIL